MTHRGVLRQAAHRALLAAAGPLLLAAGCAARVDFLPPRDAREALQRINDNFEAIEGALSASPARISARFRDADGQERRFTGYDATLIFQGPRCLYFDIKHPAIGSVANIGSNDERYWLTIDAEDYHKLTWGTWAALLSGHARPLTVPPDRLLDTLLLRPLPEQLPRGLPPLLVEINNRQELLFQMRDAYGWPYIARRMVLAAQPPYLPVEITDYLPTGDVAMRARLSGYQRINEAGAAAPYTARRYAIEFVAEDADMQLEFLDVGYRTKEFPFCEFPEGWSGPSELLDEPAPRPAVSSAQELSRS